MSRALPQAEGKKEDTGSMLDPRTSIADFLKDLGQIAEDLEKIPPDLLSKLPAPERGRINRLVSRIRKVVPMLEHLSSGGVFKTEFLNSLLGEIVTVLNMLRPS